MRANLWKTDCFYNDSWTSVYLWLTFYAFMVLPGWLELCIDTNLRFIWDSAKCFKLRGL